MDIEKLTKAQIVLLTLLVSFVTSIATGIVTVSLLDQAPPALTQTINRVVERTVERVVPDESQPASVVTREVTKTVVVNEDDLITESIDKVSKSLAEIIRVNGDAENTVGVGVVLARDGATATDGALISDGGTYDILYSSGVRVRARVVANSAQDTTALLVPLLEEGDEFAPTTAVTFVDPKTLKLGQSVIALSGGDQKRIAIGNIVEVHQSGLETTIDMSTVRSGGPLINIFGDFVGLNAADGSTKSIFASAQAVKSQLAAFRTKVEEETVATQ